MVVSRRRLNAKRLSSAVQAVLKDEQYRCAAHKVQASMLHTDGLQRAADIVEEALRVGRRNSSIKSNTSHRGTAFTLKIQSNENPLIGICLSFQGQLDEIYAHSVSDLRAL